MAKSPFYPTFLAISGHFSITDWQSLISNNWISLTWSVKYIYWNLVIRFQPWTSRSRILTRTKLRILISPTCKKVGPTCPINSLTGRSRKGTRKGSTPVLVGEIRRKDSTTGLTPSPPNNPRPKILRRLSENNGRPINKKRDSIVSKGMLRNMHSSSTTQKLTFLNKIFKNSNLQKLKVVFAIEVTVNQLGYFIIQTYIL